jgi:hypothetical protein
MLLPGPTGGPRRSARGSRVETTLLASGDPPGSGGATTGCGARPSGALASGRGAARSSLASGRLARDRLASDGLASRRGPTNRRLASDGLASRRGPTNCRLASGRLASCGLADCGLASRRLASRRLASRGLADCGLASRRLPTSRLSRGWFCRRRGARHRHRRASCLVCRHELPPVRMSRNENGGAYIHRLIHRTYET